MNIFYFFVVASILIELMLRFSMRPGFSPLGGGGGCGGGESPLNKPKINSSNGQNYSSSDSNHRIETFLPAKFPHPLMLFWKHRVLKSSPHMLTRVFWHDLQHTTTPSKKWYFATMVLTFLSIFFLRQYLVLQTS